MGEVSDRRRVQRRSIEADVKRAKAFIARSVDAVTMEAARAAHMEDRHVEHPGDFSRLCYLCRAFEVRRLRRQRMEEQDRCQG